VRQRAVINLIASQPENPSSFFRNISFDKSTKLEKNAIKYLYMYEENCWHALLYTLIYIAIFKDVVRNISRFSIPCESLYLFRLSEILKLRYIIDRNFKKSIATDMYTQIIIIRMYM